MSEQGAELSLFGPSGAISWELFLGLCLIVNGCNSRASRISGAFPCSQIEGVHHHQKIKLIILDKSGAILNTNGGIVGSGTVQLTIYLLGEGICSPP